MSLVALLGGAVAPLWAAGGSPQRPEPDAAPRRLLLAVEPAGERSLADAGELSVLLAGRPQPIVAIHRQDALANAAERHPGWRVLVYFDAPLATPDGLHRAALGLARNAERLTRMGLTEIVLADPLPVAFLAASDDPIAVRRALLDVANETSTAGELVWARQRFSSTLAAGKDDQAAATAALQAEVDLLQRQRSALLRWLVRSAGSRPRLLVLVQDGQDPNPRAFYADQAGASFLEDPRSRLSLAQLARTVAAEGWTVLALALGPRPQELDQPLAPAFELVEAAGGRVVLNHRQLGRVLDRVAAWPIVEVERGNSDGAAHDEPLPLEVHWRPSGRRLATARWASWSRPRLAAELAEGRSASQAVLQQAAAVPPPVLQLVRPPGRSLVGPVRFRTLSGRRRVERVVFLLDGEPVGEDRRPPFAATIDLGATARACKVSAVAYSRAGRKLGEDSLNLNRSLESPRVIITALESDADGDYLRVAASTTAPPDARLERLEVFFNQRLVAHSTRSPLQVRFPVDRLDTDDFVRVVGHFATGRVVETARLAASPGPVEELEVNLVEVLAFVSSRQRETDASLGKRDFIVRQAGRQLAIQHFAHWQSLPLTLGLVLDTSDSMRVVIEQVREAGTRLLRDVVRTTDRAFVVDFDSIPRLAARAEDAPADRPLALEGLEPRGQTALYDAIVFSLRQFDHAEGRRGLIVVTDGEDSSSRLSPRECVRQARRRGVPIYPILLGAPPASRQAPHLLRLRSMADRTGGRVFHLSNIEELTEIYRRIGTELRSQYLLAFGVDRALSPEELQEIEVEVRRRGLSVQTLLASQQRGG